MKVIRLILLASVLGTLAPSARAGDIRLLDPEAAPAAFVGVPWVGMLGVGVVPWAGVLLDYADDELVAVEETVDDGAGAFGRRVAVIDDRKTTTVTAGVNLWSVAQVSLAVPAFLSSGPGLDRALAAGDAQIQVKARIAGRDGEGFGFGVFAGVGLPTGSRDMWTGSGAVTGQVGLLWHFTSRTGFRLAFALRQRFRPTSGELGTVTGPGLRWGLAGHVPLHHRVGLIAELDGIVGQFDTPTDDVAHEAAIEGRLALVIRPGAGFEVKPFWGAGLTSGVGAPDFRVGLGVQWALPGPDRPDPVLRARVDGAPAGSEGLWTPDVPRDVSDPFAGATSSNETDGVGNAARFAAAVAADPDGDADSVSGDADKCPTAAEDLDGFEDDDGCPDPDNDGDTIADGVDRCPLDPETFNDFMDEDGCPEENHAAPIPTFDAVDDAFDVGEIPFLSGSDQLKEDAKPRLRQFALFFQNRPNLGRLVIEGHTDDAGDREFNVDLSERRAAAVRAYLLEQGISPRRLVARGYGATRPVAPNTTNAGRARNRRVVFRLDKDLEGTPRTGGDQR